MIVKRLIVHDHLVRSFYVLEEQYIIELINSGLEVPLHVLLLGDGALDPALVQGRLQHARGDRPLPGRVRAREVLPEERRAALRVVAEAADELHVASVLLLLAGRHEQADEANEVDVVGTDRKEVGDRLQLGLLEPGDLRDALDERGPRDEVVGRRGEDFHRIRADVLSKGAEGRLNVDTYGRPSPAQLFLLVVPLDGFKE